MTRENEKLQPVVAEMPTSSAPRTSADYAPLLAAIRERIRSAQYEALRAVNRQLRSVVEQLTKDLRQKLPGVRGYSASNRWRMLGLQAECETRAIGARIGGNHEVILRGRSGASTGAQQADRAVIGGD